MTNLKKIVGITLIASSIFLIQSCSSNNKKQSKVTQEKQSSCNDFSGTYKGTSEMGNTSGSAEIMINNDCSATLIYDQDGMGGASENGKIIEDGSNYKFKSTSGGGTYDLTISKNLIILDGSNWHCVMTNGDD